MLDALDGTVIVPERLWLLGDGPGRPLHGPDPGWSLDPPAGPGLVDTPAGLRWLAPIADEDALWLEGDPDPGGGGPSPRTRSAIEIVTHLLRVEREVARLSQELASRYEEIDLLYTISEVLGQTNKLEQAARTIVRAVSSVVGASRASIMVHDDEAGVLRTVAAQGLPPGRSGVIPVDDPTSVAARVFRDQRPLIGDPGDNGWYSAGKEERAYQGLAFMSVPICYAAPGTPSRCIGVVNLTDRVGGDRFLSGDRKLVAAIANQIGAALENARLAERERRQERLDREMELASTLQESLLPSPAVLSGDAEVGVRCVSLESVGGDFYGFNRLGGGSVAVMVGDVSSHGFAAALLMASAVVAAGIHIAALDAPDRILAALRHSLAEKLAASESYLTIFLARIDRHHGRLIYANAGHPHAFRIPPNGEPTRLEATAMPLGLGDDEIGARAVPWSARDDLLCVFTDGLIEATGATGERFGERRILDIVAARRSDHPDAIAAAVMDEVERFAPVAQDDRTLLILRT